MEFTLSEAIFEFWIFARVFGRRYSPLVRIHDRMALLSRVFRVILSLRILAPKLNS
jgi:hypothetical protein